MAMNRADLIIAVGARFDDRVTGRLDAFAPHAKKIHIDIDRSSINKIVPVDLAVLGDAGRALDALIAAWQEQGRSEEHTSELQSLMRISYAVFCLQTNKYTQTESHHLHAQKNKHTKSHNTNTT